MADTISEQITETALNPAEVAVDSQRVKAQSIDDLIKADAYTKAQTGATKNHFGMRMAKLEAPGAG